MYLNRSFRECNKCPRPKNTATEPWSVQSKLSMVRQGKPAHRSQKPSTGKAFITNPPPYVFPGVSVSRLFHFVDLEAEEGKTAAIRGPSKWVKLMMCHDNDYRVGQDDGWSAIFPCAVAPGHTIKIKKNAITIRLVQNFYKPSTWS